MTNELKPQLKRGRPLSSEDTTPRKRRNIQIHAPEEHINIKGLKEIDIEPQVDELITLKRYQSNSYLLRLYMFITMKRSLSIMYIRVKYRIKVLSLQIMFFLSK